MADPLVTALADAFVQNEPKTAPVEVEPEAARRARLAKIAAASRRDAVAHVRKLRLLSPPRFHLWRLCWALAWRLDRLVDYLGP